MKVMKRMMSVGCLVAGIGLMAAACGGEGSDCPDGQKLASINGGPEQCYTECDGGMCSDGFSCQSGLCVVDSSSNGTPNGTTNGSTNGATNGSTNGSTNGTPNGMTNGTPNNSTNQCATPVNLGLCEPLCQTGCADNEACVVGSAGPGSPLMAVCQPAGPGAGGAACDQMNGCQAGFVCGDDGSGATTCQELCAPNASMCSNAQATCAAINQEMTIGVCVVPMDACDPLNDMCPDGEVCVPTTVGKQCIAGGGKGLGEACNAAAVECNKGLYCVDIGAGPVCRELCSPQNSTCAAPAQCNPFQNDANLGICI